MDDSDNWIISFELVIKKKRGCCKFNVFLFSYDVLLDISGFIRQVSEWTVNYVDNLCEKWGHVGWYVIHNPVVTIVHESKTGNPYHILYHQHAITTHLQSETTHTNMTLSLTQTIHAHSQNWIIKPKVFDETS